MNHKNDQKESNSNNVNIRPYKIQDQMLKQK